MIAICQNPPYGLKNQKAKSFTRFFSKNRGFQRQGLWSLIAMSEILYPVKLRSGLRADALRRLAYARRCGGSFRVNCREAARGGFLQVKKPPCTNGTDSSYDVRQKRPRICEAFLFWSR